MPVLHHVHEADKWAAIGVKLDDVASWWCHLELHSNDII